MRFYLNKVNNVFMLNFQELGSVFDNSNLPVEYTTFISTSEITLTFLVRFTELPIISKCLQWKQ